MFRDAGDGKFNIFTGERVAPATTVDITGSGYTKGDLVVGDIDFTLGIMRGLLFQLLMILMILVPHQTKLEIYMFLNLLFGKYQR